jgi:hypothetical protein
MEAFLRASYTAGRTAGFLESREAYLEWVIDTTPEGD